MDFQSPPLPQLIYLDPPPPPAPHHHHWSQQQDDQGGGAGGGVVQALHHEAAEHGSLAARPGGSMALRARLAKLPPPEAALKCPRCESTNTKFCYFNNYSLTQPRHFCKTCRRYWTRGGALRNVPVGGGCRRRSSSSKNTHKIRKRGSGSKSPIPINSKPSYNNNNISIPGDILANFLNTQSTLPPPADPLNDHRYGLPAADIYDPGSSNAAVGFRFHNNISDQLWMRGAAQFPYMDPNPVNVASEMVEDHDHPLMKVEVGSVVGLGSSSNDHHDDQYWATGGNDNVMMMMMSNNSNNNNNNIIASSAWTDHHHLSRFVHLTSSNSSTPTTHDLLM